MSLGICKKDACANRTKAYESRLSPLRSRQAYLIKPKQPQNLSKLDGLLQLSEQTDAVCLNSSKNAEIGKPLRFLQMLSPSAAGLLLGSDPNAQSTKIYKYRLSTLDTIQKIGVWEWVMV